VTARPVKRNVFLCVLFRFRNTFVLFSRILRNYETKCHTEDFYVNSPRDFSLALVIIKVILKRRRVTISSWDDTTSSQEGEDSVHFAVWTNMPGKRLLEYLSAEQFKWVLKYFDMQRCLPRPGAKKPLFFIFRRGDSFANREPNPYTLAEDTTSFPFPCQFYQITDPQPITRNQFQTFEC
jgi:hypothetical protein